MQPIGRGARGAARGRGRDATGEWQQRGGDSDSRSSRARRRSSLQRARGAGRGLAQRFCVDARRAAACAPRRGRGMRRTKMRLENIVFGTDLSDASNEAVRQAAALAAASGARLTAVSVFALTHGAASYYPLPTSLPLMEQEAIKRNVTAEVQRQLERAAPGSDARIEVVIDAASASAGIIKVADERKADLIVVGSRGATGLRRLALGSVAESVVRHASSSVLVARPSPPTGRVLAATDLSEASLLAISAASAEARRRKAKITVLHCMDFPPTMMAMGFAPLVPAPPEDPKSRVALSNRAAANVREAIAKLGVEADVVVDQGPPRASIAAIAEQMPAELVVVATRGRTGLERLLLGSVCESVVRHAHCSVLAVRA
jgi:nucleotide-binding universal stress UspA family protein